MAWNRARWQALNYLTGEKKIIPAKIDGGFEFSGWSLFGREVVKHKSWWWVQDDQYVISFQPLPNYNIERVFLYHSPLAINGKIYILKRIE
jgi:hypothetical protein